MQRTTGERPVEGATPDSLLALHAAGYREVRQRLGPGTVLDVGCGLGFETVRMASGARVVVGVDYDAGAAASAHRQWSSTGLRTGCMDATALGLRGRSVSWVCSSHLIEHFWSPIDHVREVARVLRRDGTAFFLTPNRPADFENPFHLVLFETDDLTDLLSLCFEDVRVEGLDGSPEVKSDFAARRERAKRLLAMDVFDIRHKIPRKWYIAAYTRALPLAYKLMAREDTGGSSGITEGDFSVTGDVDESTLVLMATARLPREGAPGRASGPAP